MLVRPHLLPALRELESWLIEDRYFDAGRMRLRRMIREGADPVYKLCKKYGRVTTYAEPIVNIYLTLEEYNSLLAIPGQDLAKRRYFYEFCDHRFGIDEYGGPLKGLYTCEVEAQPGESVEAIAFPEFAVRDVTADEYFSGANLARTREFDWTRTADEQA